MRRRRTNKHILRMQLHELASQIIFTVCFNPHILTNTPLRRGEKIGHVSIVDPQIQFYWMT